MINVGQITADVTADMTPFSRTMGQVRNKGEVTAAQVSKGFRSLGQRMIKTGAIMAASVTAPVVAGMNKMTNEAALLEGAMAKFNVVFGDASDDMEAWVKEFRQEVPLATREIVQSAAAMQDLLVPMGIAREEATEMSKEWLTLASRLAAFNNVPVDEALEAIRSGVAGMSRPLRRFGIDARETAVQQEAMAMGLIDTTAEMDEQTRQQALLSLAYKQSKDAVDGFEQQQDSLLLMQQEVSASLKDLAASFGNILIPSAKRTAKTISDFVKRVTNLDDSTKRLILGVSSLAAAIPLVTLAVGGLSTALGILMSPITLTIAAIGGLIAIGKNVIDNWDIFAAELSHLWKGIVLSFQTGVKEVALAMNLIGLLSDDTFTEISIKTAEMRRQFELAGIKAEMSRENYVGLGETIRGLMGDIGGLVQGFSDWLFVSDQAAESGFGQQAVQMHDFSTSAKEAATNVGALGSQMAQGAEQGSITAVALKGVKDRASQAAQAGAQMGSQLGQALSQAVLHSKNLLDVLGNLAKQFASRVLMKGLSLLLSGGFSGGFSIGKLFSGIFHSGGIVGGVGDQPIIAQAGEGVFTKGQMKAMGGLIKGGGSQMSERSMQKAFERALGNYVRGVPDRKIFEMAEKGRFG